MFNVAETGDAIDGGSLAVRSGGVLHSTAEMDLLLDPGSLPSTTLETVAPVGQCLGHG